MSFEDDVKIVRTALHQGQRAMNELMWTHANVLSSEAFERMVQYTESLELLFEKERDPDVDWPAMARLVFEAEDRAERLQEELDLTRKAYYRLTDRLRLATPSSLMEVTDTELGSSG